MALVTRRTLASFLSRTLATRTASPIASPIRSRFAFAALENHKFAPESIKTLIRSKSSGSGYSPLNDPSPNWSNRPPKETILLDGCDYEHWLIVMEFTSDAKPSEDEMVSTYVKTLASVVGSEEEAKRKIYSVCTTTYTGFGALISEELSNKVKGLPGVLWVLPDSYLDVPNKDYGGDLFVDGKVIHRPQFRFDQRQQTRSRPRPRYDRRRETMQVERREPIQRDSWAQQDREPMSQSTRMTCPKDLDPAWKYGDMINTKRQKSRCKFCGHENQSGGVMRLKQHLAGGFKNVKNCHNCPQAVREEMQIRIHGKLVE